MVVVTCEWWWACLVAQMLALYYRSAADKAEARWAIEEAEAIMSTCRRMYSQTKSGLAAEAYEIKRQPPYLVPLSRLRYSSAPPPHPFPTPLALCPLPAVSGPASPAPVGPAAHGGQPAIAIN